MTSVNRTGSDHAPGGVMQTVQPLSARRVLSVTPGAPFVTLARMTSEAQYSRRAAWAMVGLTFVALGLIFALRGTLGLLMPEWETTPGWSRTLVSSGGAVILILMAVGGPLGGNLLDRWGPRPVYVGGMAVVATGVLIGAQISAAWAFVILFCGIVGLGSGALNLPTASTTMALLFKRRQGLVTGIALAGASGGQLLLMPLLAVTIGAVGWRSTYMIIAAALIGLAVVAAMLLRGAPSAGDEAASPAPEPTEPGNMIGRLGFLFTNRAFLLMLGAFTLCGFTTAGVVDVHFLPYAAACGFPPLESTTAYGILGVANMFGVIVFGWLADKMSPRLLLAAMFFARAGSFVILMHIVGDWPLLLTFAVLFGLLNFATLPVLAAIVRECLGVRIMGLSLGLLFGGHSLGAAAGALMGGWLFDLFAHYDWVWNVALALAILAGLLTLMIRPGTAAGRDAAAAAA